VRGLYNCSPLHILLGYCLIIQFLVCDFGMVQYTVGPLCHAKFGPAWGEVTDTGAPELEHFVKSHFCGVLAFFCRAWATLYTDHVEIGIRLSYSHIYAEK